MYDRKKFRSAQNVTDVSFFVVRHGSGHFRDDNFGNVMEHFYDSTGMTIFILS